MNGQTLNRFAYVNGNPVSMVDPLGLCGEKSGGSSLDKFQTVLDVAGLAPGFGEVADGLNALIYLGRGDYSNALLSGGAMIPFLGWGATAGKLGKKALKYGDDVVEGVSKNSDTIMHYGVCFTGETLVKVKDGHRKIEDIEVGDEVLSEDSATGEQNYKTVKQIFINESYELYTISLKDTQIETTAPHPFYVVGKGWLEAKDVKKGDILKLASSESIEVISNEVTKLARPVKVYNFEVEDWHTYYVSALDVLVHNTSSNPCAQAGGRAGKQTRLKELANDDKLSSSLRGEIKRDINEIAAGKRKNIRVPEGYNLAHRRGFEAKNGFGYEYSDLQDIGLHKLQHKIEGY